MRPTCGDCKHFRPDHEGFEGVEDMPIDGECRAALPQVSGGRWPRLDSHQDCGQHQPIVTADAEITGRQLSREEIVDLRECRQRGGHDLEVAREFVLAFDACRSAGVEVAALEHADLWSDLLVLRDKLAILNVFPIPSEDAS